MSIEMAAIDALTEDGQMSPELAIAMAKSIDLSLTSANLVTMTVFNERFAQSDIRFAELHFQQIDQHLQQIDQRLQRIDHSSARPDHRGR